MRPHLSTSLLLLLGATAVGCAFEAPVTLDAQLQRTRAAAGFGTESFLSTHLLVTDSSGKALGCGDAEVTATVRVTFDGGTTWDTVSSGDVAVACDGAEGDLAVVLDNSGSTADVLDDLRTAAETLTDPVYDADGRVSYVRVSTDAEVLSGLTDDATDRDDALDALVEDGSGWTALYDGVRMANETLGKARADVDAFRDLNRFCGAADRLGIVVFTDGAENNSTESQDYDKTAFPGDGYDTTKDDLLSLHVGGQTTPIYTVGLGDDADHEALGDLAGATGGRHHAVQSSSDLDDVFDVISDYFDAGHQVCAALDGAGCGEATVEVSWTATDDDGATLGSGTVTQDVQVDCPIVSMQGTHATLLLTLSNPGIPKAEATQLAVNAVEAVTPVTDPKVLVVLDDNHHNEFKGDADYIEGLLDDEGYDVTRLDEANKGLTATDVDGYDVVWFSNPGYPIDDRASVQVLADFSADGGGVVFQGDDMSWSAGAAFSMTPFTGLTHLDNGTKRCGKRTDNNKGEDVEVLFTSATTDLSDGLEAEAWDYGDDVDRAEVPSALSAQVTVHATADLSGKGCGTTPAVVTYQP